MPYGVVEVELKTKGGDVQHGELDAIKVSPDNYKVVIDNPQVRVARARVGPRASVAMHEHPMNRVVVFLTDARIRVVGKDGSSEEATLKAGEVRWAGPAVHREENLSDEPLEVVSVDIKP
jgi:quercetin dioxygenase-like cupin family protein